MAVTPLLWPNVKTIADASAQTATLDCAGHMPNETQDEETRELEMPFACSYKQA